MKSHAWNQFLVVTEFMNPAQREQGCQPVELGRIVAE